MKQMLTCFTVVSLLFVLPFTGSGQQKEYVKKGVAKDARNYLDLLRILSDTALFENPQEFLNKFPSKEAFTEDRDFGARLEYRFQPGYYAGYWVRALMFKNQMVGFDIYSGGIDSVLFERMLKEEPRLLVGAHKIRPRGADVFHFENKAGMQRYRLAVDHLFGKTELRYRPADAELAKEYDLLMDPFDNYEYGYRCGYGGSLLKARTAIRRLTLANDTSAIREVLISCNPAGRVYAMEAMLAMSKLKMVHLTNNDKRRIYLIITSPILINTCDGCISYKDTAAKIYTLPFDYKHEEETIREENQILEEMGLPKRGGY